MKSRILGVMLGGAVALSVSSMAYAAPITSVKDYSNNQVGEHFVEAGSESDPNNWRGATEDWSWQHSAIAGSAFSSVSLSIYAFDVDSAIGELDQIFVFTGANWLSLGFLAGLDEAWSTSVFNITGDWVAAQVNAGMQFKIDIDVNNDDFYVALGRSTLSVEPVVEVPVPVPATALLLGMGLLLMGASRRG